MGGAVVGDGVDLTVGESFGYPLRFYGRTDSLWPSPTENLLVEGEEIAVAGTIQGVIGSTSRPPLAVVGCGNPRLIASIARETGTVSFFGRLDVKRGPRDRPSR